MTGTRYTRLPQLHPPLPNRPIAAFRVGCFRSFSFSYTTNYLDLTGVTYAAIGMARGLGFDDSVFGVGSGAFFLSYVALQIPADSMPAG